MNPTAKTRKVPYAQREPRKLKEARAKRYRHAARHLLECESLAAGIASFGKFNSHTEYVAGLRKAHARKTGFWSLFD